MANQRKSNQRRPANRPASRSQDTRRRDPRQQSARRRSTRRTSRSGLDLTKLLAARPKADFRPDAEDSGILKKLHLTQVQRDRYLKWGLYIAVIVLLQMIQDVIMCKFSFFGGTTDLPVCVILLITVIEGIDTGSIFVLIFSCLFYFTGSSPGPMSVGIMTFLGIGACLFRQMYWHRNRASIVLCAGLALMLYEIGTFIVGISTGLTRWDHFSAFLVTGALSVAVMIPLYSLINRIGQIGGNAWKE